MSLGTGATVWLWLSLLGVDYPILWALLAFPPQLRPQHRIGHRGRARRFSSPSSSSDPRPALWTAAGYLAANVFFGNVLEPRFMGRGVGLSALVVFLSLVFWGWVLGPVGMFLSVPLTITAKIALAANDETRWAAVLLGTGGEAAAGASMEPGGRTGSDEVGRSEGRRPDRRAMKERDPAPSGMAVGVPPHRGWQRNAPEFSHGARATRAGRGGEAFAPPCSATAGIVEYRPVAAARRAAAPNQLEAPVAAAGEPGGGARGAGRR